MILQLENKIRHNLQKTVREGCAEHWMKKKGGNLHLTWHTYLITNLVKQTNIKHFPRSWLTTKIGYYTIKEAPLKTVNFQTYMPRMSHQTGGHLNYIIKNMLHNFQSTTISFLNVYSQEWQNVQYFGKYYEIFYIFTRLKNKFARESLHIYLNKGTTA